VTTIGATTAAAVAIVGMMTAAATIATTAAVMVTAMGLMVPVSRLPSAVPRLRRGISHATEVKRAAAAAAAAAVVAVAVAVAVRAARSAVRRLRSGTRPSSRMAVAASRKLGPWLGGTPCHTLPPTWMLHAPSPATYPPIASAPCRDDTLIRHAIGWEEAWLLDGCEHVG